MVRAPCCEKEGLKKGPWTPEEDKILVDYIQSNGHGSWRSLPKLAGLLRCGKSCRLRWTNYLRPDIKRGPFTVDEQKTIIQLHGIVGNKWSTIAAQLPGRTDNEVKNYWNTHLKKRLMKMGIDPDTYTSATTAVTLSGDPSSSLLSSSSSSSYARHMAQWESARLEAEARLAKESLLHSPSDTSVGEEVLATVSDKMETDFFLKIWNSEVGRAFRAKETRAVAHPISEVQGSSSSTSSPTISSNIKLKEETSEEGATTTTTTTSEEENYQMYLDLAAVGMDYDSLGFSSLFSNIQFGSFSLFDGGDHHCINDESSLDGIDGFINKWEDGDNHHHHHHHHHIMDKTQKTSAISRV